jgi:hypothetical protein
MRRGGQTREPENGAGGDNENKPAINQLLSASEITEKPVAKKTKFSLF